MVEASCPCQKHRYFLRGEFDLEVVAQVRADLMGAVADNDAHLLVDCRDLTFIDSTGIAVLLEANRELEDDGRHLLIVNIAPEQRRVFEVLGLTDLLRYDCESVV